MQKAFEKIVDRLEELKKKDCTKNQDDNYVVKNTKDLMRLAYNNAIKIANQVAEEYKTTILNDLEIVASLPSLYPMMQDFEEEAILNVVASVNNDSWIPCSSGVMPKYGDNVLVSLNYAFLPLIATLYEDNTWKMLQGVNGLIDITGKVIAWRELPQPYQPKGE